MPFFKLWQKHNQWYFEISSDRAKYGNNKKFLASWNWIVPKILHYAFLHILIIVMNGYHQTMALLFHYFCGNFFPNFGLPRWQSRLKIANKIAKVSKPRFRGFLVFGMYTQTSIWWTSVSDPFFSLYRIIHLYQMLSKSSKWELGIVQYIAKFTISRFITLKNEN